MSTAVHPASPTAAQAPWTDLLQEMLPVQGAWTDEQFLVLTEHARRLVEFTDGHLEVLPMPTDRHQGILRFLLFLFVDFVEPRGGIVRFAPLRLRIREGKFREPDLMLLHSKSDPRRENRFWTGADLALEVVSEDKPERDLVDKRTDYAEGRIPEYWIVDPITETITVLSLDGDTYREAGRFGRGENAASMFLSGFSVLVASVFDVK